MGKETSQKQRRLNALSSDYFKVDERTLYDLYEEVRLMAKVIKFYPGNEQETQHDWAPFFGDAKPYLELLSNEPGLAMDKVGDCPPHLALILTFLKLFQQSQQRLNDLTYSHLDFFYNRFLGEQRKPAIPSRVYLFALLARDVTSYVLEKGEAFFGGKDRLGRPILFTNDTTVSLSHAQVVDVRSTQRSSADGRMYTFPVSNSADGWGAPLAEGQGWRPFGDSEKGALSLETGFAFSSPMLLMQEGRRKLWINFKIEKKIKGETLKTIPQNLIEVQVTSSEGWIVPSLSEFEFTDTALSFALELLETDAKVVAFDSAIHGYNVPGLRYPLLKLVLKGAYTYEHYHTLQSLRFGEVNVRSEIHDVHPTNIRNDFGELDVTKPFHPFGFTPLRGSNFYIGLGEEMAKALDSLTLHFQWKGLPEDGFKNYYEGYKLSVNSLVNKDDEFKVTAAIRSNKEWREVRNNKAVTGEYALFDKVITLEKPVAEDVTRSSDEATYPTLRITLSSPQAAFGHSLYPAVYAKAIIAQLQNRDAPIPNEPFTPVVESVTLSYNASESISLGNENRSFRYFHIKPFGIEELGITSSKLPLISGELNDAGSLFIGITGVQPPQQISLFFEIAELSFQEKPSPIFYYLSPRGWKRFAANALLTDTTMGLQATGLIVMNLPEDMTSSNPSMPSGLLWIRISVLKDAEAFDPIIALRTNCFICTQDTALSPAEGDMNVLLPFSIAAPLHKNRAIKKVEQPYPSFGGRPSESNDDYFVRASETLRHKGRGITSWDIERIILQEFPDVYKVKCIPYENGKGERTPGSIHVIVIPYIDKQSHSLRPFVSGSRLKTIQEHMKRRVCPQADLLVTNPVYEEIRVKAQINFINQSDSGFYIQKLQEEIIHFLSPWTVNENTEIETGNRFSRSALIEFIESLPYVNFISTIDVFRDERSVEDQLITPDERTVIISSAEHDIEAVSASSSRCQTNQGIEQMIVDINFEVL